VPEPESRPRQGGHNMETHDTLNVFPITEFLALKIRVLLADLFNGLKNTKKTKCINNYNNDC